MMIYKQHFFRRRKRVIPSPSCLPITITFGLLFVCLIAIMSPVVSGINVNMPSLKNHPVEIYDDFKYVNIFINENSIITINGIKTMPDDISKVIKIIYKDVLFDDIKIFIKADKNVAYNTIVEVLKILNNDGFSDLVLVGKYIGGKTFYRGAEKG